MTAQSQGTDRWPTILRIAWRAGEVEHREPLCRDHRDAGFDPIHLGDLGQAPLLESLIALTRVLEIGDLGPFFYRFNRPGELLAT